MDQQNDGGAGAGADALSNGGADDPNKGAGAGNEGGLGGGADQGAGGQDGGKGAGADEGAKKPAGQQAGKGFFDGLEGDLAELVNRKAWGQDPDFGRDQLLEAYANLEKLKGTDVVEKPRLDDAAKRAEWFRAKRIVESDGPFLDNHPQQAIHS